MIQETLVEDRGSFLPSLRNLTCQSGNGIEMIEVQTIGANFIRLNHRQRTFYSNLFKLTQDPGVQFSLSHFFTPEN